MLTATVFASSLDFIDGSVVNVGLPAIGHSLHGNAADLQWIINAYLLPLSALPILGGSLGDRYGRRRLLVVGIAIFAAASAACACSTRLEWLILARGLQGVAAALVLPNSLAILGDAFDGPERGQSVGIWAASASMAGAVGPVLGGWLIDTVGWRAIFLVNLPLAVAAIAIALYAVDDDEPHPGEARLDVAGATLITAALAGMTWGLTEGAGLGGWTIPAVTALVAGFVLAAAFVRTEQRRGDWAMTPPALFGSRPLVALNLLTLLLYGALTGFLLLTPYRLITSIGYSATAAGAALLPFALIMSLASPAMGRLAGRIGARPLLIAGALLVAFGFVLTRLPGQVGSYWTTVLPSIVAVALGMVCAATPLTAAVLGSVDAHHTGAASGLNSAVAQLGGVIAIALIGGVLTTRGDVFAQAFRVAAFAGVCAALGAALCIVLLFRDTPKPTAIDLKFACADSPGSASGRHRMPSPESA